MYSGRRELAFIILITLAVKPGQQQEGYQSIARLTNLGTEFQPANSNENIGTLSNVNSLIRCFSYCNQNSQCGTFDYDYTSFRCRLFQAHLTYGTVMMSSSSTSTVGALYGQNQYNAYNQSCDNRNINWYLVCNKTSNLFECPPHQFWNGTLCLNQLYYNFKCNATNWCRNDVGLICTFDGLCGCNDSQQCWNGSFCSNYSCLVPTTTALSSTTVRWTSISHNTLTITTPRPNPSICQLDLSSSSTNQILLHLFNPLSTTTQQYNNTFIANSTWTTLTLSLRSDTSIWYLYAVYIYDQTQITGQNILLNGDYGTGTLYGWTIMPSINPTISPGSYVVWTGSKIL
ncbi:unnamed protein product, partial [Didymodactylos carnosus]